MRIYIDTSVINGLYAQDATWIKQVSEAFFNVVKEKGYILYISDIVSDEVRKTPDAAKRENLLDIIRTYSCRELSKSQQSEEVANKYIQAQIIPAKYVLDALHIAIASVHKIPVLVSWNFKHIVRHKTRVGVNAINKNCGYPQIDICSPEEVD